MKGTASISSNRARWRSRCPSPWAAAVEKKASAMDKVLVKLGPGAMFGEIGVYLRVGQALRHHRGAERGEVAFDRQR